MVFCKLMRASASFEGAIINSDVALMLGEVCDRE